MNWNHTTSRGTYICMFTDDHPLYLVYVQLRGAEGLIVDYLELFDGDVSLKTKCLGTFMFYSVSLSKACAPVSFRPVWYRNMSKELLTLLCVCVHCL